jgi:hypothetical protein
MLVTFILDVSEVLWQTLKLNSSHKNKEGSSCQCMSGNEWFLRLIERLHSTLNTLGYGYIGARTDTTQQTNICLGIHCSNVWLNWNRQPFCPLQWYLNPVRTAASIGPDCRLETNSLWWRQTFGGDNVTVLSVFSVAPYINSNVFDFCFLIWSLSWLLCCCFWFQCSRSLNCVMSYLQLTQYVCSMRSQFYNLLCYWLLSHSVQQMLKMSSTWIIVLMNMSDHGPPAHFQRSWGSGGWFENICKTFDTHGSVHRRLLSRNTNKM